MFKPDFDVKRYERAKGIKKRYGLAWNDAMRVTEGEIRRLAL